jgi:hypothetical protein
VISARLERIGCFDTFSEAIEAGSGGSIRLADSTSPRELTDDLMAESTTSRISGNTLIGTEWTATQYTQSSREYWADNACQGVIWEVPYVGDNWNDDFESGKAFGGCDTNKKFGHADFDGTVVTCTPNCSDYGILKNQVSSLRWKP